MRTCKTAGGASKGKLFLSMAILAVLASALVLTGVTSAGQLSWSTGGPIRTTISCLGTDPRNPGVVYAGSYNQSGMFKTTNAGQSWVAINNGFPSTDSDAVLVDPSNSAIVYAGTRLGVYKSVNGGASWSASGLPQFRIWSLAVVPQNPAILYAGTSGNGIYKSTNTGASWTDISLGINHPTIWCIAVDPRNANNLFIGTSTGGVYRSQNAGQSWAQTNVGFPDLPTIGSLAIDENNPTVMYAGARERGIFKSTNAGQSWTAVNTGLPGRSATVWSLLVERCSRGTLYAAIYESGIYRSTNGGANWGDFNSGFGVFSFYCITADKGSPITLYAGTELNGVWQYTTNPCCILYLPIIAKE